MWERSFIVVSVLSGASLDEAKAMLGPVAEAGAEGMLEQLHPTRAPKIARARALAEVVQEVAVALSEMTLR